MTSPLRSELGVSVVLATYNRADYIDQAISSLLEQTRPVNEILVVDDGSTDETPKLLLRYPSPVRFIRQENSGRAVALNHGAEHVSGEWLWFFDDDDIALPDALERMLAALAADPTADFAYSSQIIGREGPNGTLSRERETPLPSVAPEALFHYAMKDYPFRTQGMLIRRASFIEVGGFDRRYLRGQDYEFYMRFLRRFRGAPVDGPTFVLRNHDAPRGPKHQQHAARDRNRVWMHYNAMMGLELRERLPLGEYLFPPARSWQLPPTTERRALVHRMAVMASKGLIMEMVEDVRAAARIQTAAPGGLCHEEAWACFNAATSEFFVRSFLESPAKATNALVAAGRNSGGDILAYLARGTMWAGRVGNLRFRDRLLLLASGVRLLMAAKRWPRRTW